MLKIKGASLARRLVKGLVFDETPVELCMA
jgi:hypothetical protein